ncbi:hypothetical protein OXYTRIMIC_488 [Oxytricha trifallax]|uniref:Uncharacterized protein n=1 Tax=Oxytricha trifallax TaxID=1172189 RepID=A0A073IBK9_9SPIT|nr:hypothetical protein OXYTRIMIC_488 [Oxytricha trifallax]
MPPQLGRQGEHAGTPFVVQQSCALLNEFPFLLMTDFLNECLCFGQNPFSVKTNCLALLRGENPERYSAEDFLRKVVLTFHQQIESNLRIQAVCLLTPILSLVHSTPGCKNRCIIQFQHDLYDQQSTFLLAWSPYTLPDVF